MIRNIQENLNTTTIGKMNIDKKLTLLIILWILDKVIMLIMLMILS